MLIPIGTNVQHSKKPRVTYFIIGLNLLIFAMQWAISRSGGTESADALIRFLAVVEHGSQLSSQQFHIWSLITYQFLHGGWMHLLINMVFLLPFGKAVEDRLGHIGFALFYVGCGAFGGFVHTLLYDAPVVGASGSVCAVVAAFIVLAPKTKIHVLFIFFIIGIYTVPSLLLVAFFIALDTFSLLASLVGKNSSATAWIVHIGGYISGFVVTFFALSIGMIRSSEYDLPLLLRQSKKRRAVKHTLEQTAKKHTTDAKEDPESALRISIAEEALRDTSTASKTYFNALETYPKLKIDRRTHHLIGSFLIQENNTEDGVQVFERYLTDHKSADDCPEVALLMAAKYTRILNNPNRAKELLHAYGDTFSPSHKSLATTIEHELER